MITPIVAMLASRFIGGSNIIKAASRIKTTPYQPIYDRAKEACRTSAEGQEFTYDLIHDVNTLTAKGAESNKGIMALKYSSFYPHHMCHPSKAHVARIAYVLYRMKAAGVHRALIDAESEAWHAIENVAMEKLIPAFNKSGVFVYKTYQMYRRDAMDELLKDMSLHPHLGIKLVRGAYHHQDVNTQKLFTNKAETDYNYNNALQYVLRSLKFTRHELMVASHNDTSLEIAASFLRTHPDLTNRVMFAQLLGMNDMASNRLQQQGFHVYKYVPYGSFTETLPYLARRLVENYDVLRHVM